MAENEAKEKNTKNKKSVTPKKYFSYGAVICIAVGVGLYIAYMHYKGSKYHYFEQWAVVAIAVLGACVSLYTAAKQEENVDKWNQKRLNADIKATAIIKWIQNVREATTSFVSSCYSMIRIIENGNKDEIRKCFKDINEKSILLKLYFGPDKNGDNEKIIKMIEEIVSYAEDYFVDIKNDYTKNEIKKCEKQIKALSNSRLKAPEEIYAIKKDKELIIKGSFFKKVDLEDKLNDFVEELRRYLKEEWKKARDNK